MNDKTTKTVIAAQPGFDVTDLCIAPHEFAFAPVVAWVIEVPDDYDSFEAASAGVFPVCADWNFNDGNVSDKIVRKPDGTITFFDGATFTKGREAEALAYAVEKRRSLREAT